MASAASEVLQDYEVPVEREKSLLRLITCGSVDDGKSTLIGRLLYDAKQLSEDHVASLRTVGEELDFASLLDGLSAEREQGITIDVAYRHFQTARRRFIIADTPGHEQYTRNMVTGASTADLAVILIDARKGVLPQTRRHSLLVQLLGVREIVLAINKMDLVGYDRARFDQIVSDYEEFARDAGIGRFTAIPLSALSGENLAARGASMAWYDGPPLLDHLDTVELSAESAGAASFVLPVQWVNRPGSAFRGYAGSVAQGSITPGDEVTILPSGRRTSVERIVTMDGDLAAAQAGQAVTLTFADEVDCSRGDLIVSAGAAIPSGDRIAARLVWMGNEPLVPGRAYWLKTGTSTVSASVARVTSQIDVETLAQGEAGEVRLNAIVECEIVLDRDLPALPYRQNRELGGFILIDRAGNATVAGGMIETIRADGEEAGAPEHGRIVRLTGSDPEARLAFAHKAQARLRARGRASYILDLGDLKRGLNSDLAADDREEAKRRAAEVARLMSAAGVTVLLTQGSDELVPADEIALDVDDAEPDHNFDWII